MLKFNVKMPCMDRVLMQKMVFEIIKKSLTAGLRNLADQIEVCTDCQSMISTLEENGYALRLPEPYQKVLEEPTGSKVIDANGVHSVMPEINLEDFSVDFRLCLVYLGEKNDCD